MRAHLVDVGRVGHPVAVGGPGHGWVVEQGIPREHGVGGVQDVPGVGVVRGLGVVKVGLLRVGRMIPTQLQKKKI